MILIYKFGLPERLHPDGAGYILREQEDEAEKKKFKFYKWWSGVGILLLIAGFGLQLASNYI